MNWWINLSVHWGKFDDSWFINVDELQIVMNCHFSYSNPPLHTTLSSNKISTNICSGDGNTDGLSWSLLCSCACTRMHAHIHTHLPFCIFYVKASLLQHHIVGPLSLHRPQFWFHPKVADRATEEQRNKLEHLRRLTRMVSLCSQVKNNQLPCQIQRWKILPP